MTAITRCNGLIRQLSSRLLAPVSRHNGQPVTACRLRAVWRDFEANLKPHKAPDPLSGVLAKETSSSIEGGNGHPIRITFGKPCLTEQQRALLFSGGGLRKVSDL